MPRLTAAVFVIIATAVAPLFGAPPSTPTPLPPSAVIFNGSNTFNDSAERWDAPVNVPQDGAWLLSRASNFINSSYMDCQHKYAADLTPNFSAYPAPLFRLGVDQGRPEACLGGICYSCYAHWGGQPTYTYYTTEMNPGFLNPGGGVVSVRTLTAGGQHDTLHLYLTQVNRDAMERMTMFLSRAEDDPLPLQPDEIKSAYWIANSADRVAVVPEFQYGTDWFPAGPGVTFAATWDNGSVVVPEVNTSSLMPAAGYSILGVPIPKLPTGTHTFTVKATLPSGKTFTTEPMAVFLYSQNIYITVEGNFNEKNPVDQAPQFIPGAALNGTNLDLRSTPQMLQLNILIGRGSRGTFNVRLTNVSRYPGITMNYPLSANDTNPDIDFGAGDLELFDVPIPKGGAPKVVKLPLYVYDYAASATIEVTMPYRKTTFTARRRIPLDTNSNSLPDAGWHLQTGEHILETSLNAAGDVDTNPPGIGDPIDTSIGDGLSNFEEYRGFFFAGSYQRFDPDVKDLVLVVDATILTDAQTLNFFTSHVPFRKHYADLAEVSGEAYTSRLLEKVKPVVNPNRTGVPGARSAGQRGVRIVEQEQFPPAYVLAGAGFPAWQMGTLGITWVDDMPNLDVINAPENAAGAVVQSPDETQFVEVYPHTLRNHGIATDFSHPSAYRDASGNVVPDCNVSNTTNCDIWDTAHGMIVPRQLPAGNYIFNTVLNPATMPGDHYSKYARTCAAPDQVLPQGFTAAQMDQLYTVLVAHELGHALQLEHRRNTLTDCRSIMFDNMLPGTGRRTWADMLPLPTSYGDLADLMRLWQ